MHRRCVVSVVVAIVCVAFGGAAVAQELRMSSMRM